ncbi:MAG: ArsB/NhaD family transporter [Anaerolineales bacterium]|nr:ArsB/NhaD family transporter [Anaerolineales bacterium]
MNEIIAVVIFLACLAVIFTDKLHRTTIAIAGAILMVAAGRLLGFYSEPAAIAAVDFNTLGLLLGMMILVAILEPTGFFQFLAVWAGRISMGRPVRLLVLLGLVTTVLSMFLDNVTTVVLVAPVTILICEILGIQSVPFLVAEAILANTGGVATLIGDPPNILIASAAGFSFNDFLVHSLPLILIVWLVALLLTRYLFRKELEGRPTNAEAVIQLNPKEALDDPKTVRRVLVILGTTIGLFFLQELLGLSPAFIALSAASVAMIWIQPPMKQMLERIEWNVLLFFTALFIMVGGLESAGVLKLLAELISRLQVIPPLIFDVVFIWVVAFLTALVGSVPITIGLIPVIQQLELNGMNVIPLWWALAFGAGLGGNGTIIGSMANIIVASLSERTRTPITSKLWNKRGLPVMLATCTVISILYALWFPSFSR